MKAPTVAVRDGHAGLLGRDVLRNFRFNHAGLKGAFELASDRYPVSRAPDSEPT
jgi:hypothetical protein